MNSKPAPIGELIPQTAGANSSGKVGVVFTCLDACMPLDQAGLFGGLLPANRDLVVLRSAEQLTGEPTSDGVKSLLVAVHAMQANYICVLRHKDCKLRSADGKALGTQMVENGVNPAWLKGFDPATWIRPVGNEEESLAKEITFLSEWSLIPPSVHVVGLLYDDAKRRFTVIGNRPPHSPLVIYDRKSSKGPAKLASRLRLRSLPKRKALPLA